MTTINGHTTRATGTVLTAAIYNFDHNNHITNADNLNAGKMEGAAPPVVDGEIAVWDGTGGNALRSGGFAPAGPGQTDLAIADGGTGASTAATAFSNLKQDATAVATGVVKHASVSEVRAATTGNLVLTAAILESAAALVSLTDAATVAVDWDAAINFSLTIAGNRTLGTPTNSQPGTWRSVYVVGNDATLRTLTFSSDYRGDVPVIANISNAREYLLTIFCKNSSHFVVSSKRAFGAA